jgi:hypothetical protein
MGCWSRVPSTLPAVGAWLLALVPAAAQEPPRFAAGVDLVVADAVVLDGDGQPVGGLTREDFELRDEGEPREILSFEAFGTAPRPAPLSPGARGGCRRTSISPRKASSPSCGTTCISLPRRPNGRGGPSAPGSSGAFAWEIAP